MKVPKEAWGGLLNAASQDGQEEQLVDMLLTVNLLFQKHSSLRCTYLPRLPMQNRGLASYYVQAFQARTHISGLRSEGSEVAAQGSSGRWGQLWGLPAAPLGLTVGGEHRWPSRRRAPLNPGPRPGTRALGDIQGRPSVRPLSRLVRFCPLKCLAERAKSLRSAAAEGVAVPSVRVLTVLTAGGTRASGSAPPPARGGKLPRRARPPGENRERASPATN